MQSDESLKIRIEKILPILNENQRRIYLAAEAESIGWGGITKEPPCLVLQEKL